MIVTISSDREKGKQK